MRGWTSGEVAYLEGHASDGAEAIADALDRTVASVQVQASRLGVSLRMSWVCPKCGLRTYRPLSDKTGWCRCCTKESRLPALAEQADDMAREAAREREANRARQRQYARKSREKLTCVNVEKKDSEK